MKYAIEMGIDGVIYVPSLKQIGPDIQILRGGGGEIHRCRFHNEVNLTYL
jgi:hypothetical protein